MTPPEQIAMTLTQALAIAGVVAYIALLLIEWTINGILWWKRRRRN